MTKTQREILKAMQYDGVAYIWGGHRTTSIGTGGYSGETAKPCIRTNQVTLFVLVRDGYIQSVPNDNGPLYKLTEKGKLQ